MLIKGFPSPLPLPNGGEDEGEGESYDCNESYFVCISYNYDTVNMLRI